MKRFQYRLEPVLRTREWELQDEQAGLGEANLRLAHQRQSVESLRARHGGAANDWAALVGSGQVLAVDALLRLRRYMAELESEARAADITLAAIEVERDAAAQRVAACRRAVDAFEDHRAQLRLRFDRARATGDFKAADDQWNTSHARSTTDEHLS